MSALDPVPERCGQEFAGFSQENNVCVCSHLSVPPTVVAERILNILALVIRILRSTLNWIK